MRNGASLIAKLNKKKKRQRTRVKKNGRDNIYYYIYISLSGSSMELGEKYLKNIIFSLPRRIPCVFYIYAMHTEYREIVA